MMEDEETKLLPRIKDQNYLIYKRQKECKKKRPFISNIDNKALDWKEENKHRDDDRSDDDKRDSQASLTLAIHDHEDSIKSGESHFKLFSFEPSSSNKNLEKCVAFWKGVLATEDLKPVKCTLIEPEDNGEECIKKKKKKKKKKSQKTESIGLEDNEDINTIESSNFPWLLAFLELQKKNLDKVALATTRKKCKMCKHNDLVYKEEATVTEDDIVGLNEWIPPPSIPLLRPIDRIKQEKEAARAIDEETETENIITSVSEESKETKSSDKSEDTLISFSPPGYFPHQEVCLSPTNSATSPKESTSSSSSSSTSSDTSSSKPSAEEVADTPEVPPGGVIILRYPMIAENLPPLDWPCICNAKAEENKICVCPKDLKIEEQSTENDLIKEENTENEGSIEESEAQEGSGLKLGNDDQNFKTSKIENDSVDVSEDTTQTKSIEEETESDEVKDKATQFPKKEPAPPQTKNECIICGLQQCDCMHAKKEQILSKDVKAELFAQAEKIIKHIIEEELGNISSDNMLFGESSEELDKIVHTAFEKHSKTFMENPNLIDYQKFEQFVHDMVGEVLKKHTEYSATDISDEPSFCSVNKDNVEDQLDQDSSKSDGMVAIKTSIGVFFPHSTCELVENSAMKIRDHILYYYPKIPKKRVRKLAGRKL